VPLLRAIVGELEAGAPNAPAKPHRFFDAGWLGMRYAEVLPIPVAAKQKLLEIEDSIDRLEIIYRFLEEQGFAARRFESPSRMRRIGAGSAAFGGVGQVQPLQARLHRGGAGLTAAAAA
jgi:hypothetical protein